MPLPNGYQEQDPASDVALDHISGAETFWSFVATKAGETVILPDGRCDVIFYGQARGAQIEDVTPIVTGPATRGYHLEYHPGEVWLGARLQPWMARSLWGDQITAAQDQVLKGVAAKEVLGVLQQVPDVAASADLHQYLVAIEAGLEHAGRGELPDNALSRALSLIRLSGGQIAIHELAAQLQVSERQLNRRFTAQVGMTPKLYASIIRFHRALRLIRDLGLSTSDAAYEAGYSDQAHLTRSFRRFGGFSPAKLPQNMSLPGFSKLN